MKNYFTQKPKTDLLAQKLASYSSYHNHPITIFLHMICVPAILFGALIIINWITIPVIGLSIVWLVALALLLYYWQFDQLLCYLTGALFLILLFIIYATPLRLMSAFSIQISLYCFIGGWFIQIISHWLEKEKPAFLDNHSQILTAIIYFVAELTFLCGAKQELYLLYQKYLKKILAHKEALLKAQTAAEEEAKSSSKKDKAKKKKEKTTAAMAKDSDSKSAQTTAPATSKLDSVPEEDKPA